MGALALALGYYAYFPAPKEVSVRFHLRDGFIQVISTSALDAPDFIGYTTGWDRDVVAPRLSATVMLLRDSVPGRTAWRIDDGVFPANFVDNQSSEVFMIRRASTMAFEPNAMVFPGGCVDRRDADCDLPWSGPSIGRWAEWMKCSERDARLVIVAAVRELFEESGVLLATPRDVSENLDLRDPMWRGVRSALARHEISFSEVLNHYDLVLRSELLCVVENALTPANEPRRYDTYFFAAMLPEGQAADGETSEADAAGWCTPAYAIREADAGRWKVVTPTFLALTLLGNANSSKSFVSMRRIVDKITLHAEKIVSGEEGLDAAECGLILRWSRDDELVY